MGQSNETYGTFIPQRPRIGFGIWTMLPIRDGRSLSIDGRGHLRTVAPVPCTRGRRVSRQEGRPR
jgi:hypothetical protein